MDRVRPTVSRYCGRLCRQQAFRARRAAQLRESDAQSKRIGYADPPYPGRAWMYKDQPSYAGEVDHAELIASLKASYDGWALSTSADALQDLLPLCPKGVHVAAWHKPLAAQSTTYGMHNVWEPVSVWPARELRPGIADALRALPARGGGDLIGRKPLKFCGWLFGLLGALPGDQFFDLFPGSGIVARAWSAYASPLQERHVSPVDGEHVSQLEGRHMSRAAAGYTLSPTPNDACRAAPDDTSPAGVSDVSARATSDAFADGTGDASPRGIADTYREDLDDACQEYSGDRSNVNG